MSEGYGEYRPRSEFEKRVDSSFIACSRYYDDIREANDARSVGTGAKRVELHREGYAELVGSLDNLKARFGYDSADVDCDVDTPSMELYVNDMRQAIEQFKLYPLKAFGPIVDATFPAERTQEWYEFITDMITAKDEFHGGSCLTVTYKNSHQTCRHSLECPRKVLRLALMSPVLNANFDDPAYKQQPEIQMDLAARKMDVAAKKGIENRHIAFVALNHYRHVADLNLGPS